MNEIKLHEIYRDGNELEMILYLSDDEFISYTAGGHKLRRISERTVANENGQIFRIFAYVVEAGAPGRSYTMSAYDWRILRNRLMTLACTVNIYSKEYANLSRRIAWINRNRL